jgi:CheY-like chemotaxis protein
LHRAIEENMGQRVFVDVVGFSDEERHALNLLFRMSEEHGTRFVPWHPEAPGPARMALVDGDCFQAHVEAESPRNFEIPLIWVGDAAPAHSVHRFERPIAWPEVVQLMNELFPPPLEYELDLDSLETRPPDAGPSQLPPQRRVLIAAASYEERLYLRARLALANLPLADEAENAAQALELARANDYALALMDLALPGGDGWNFVAELSAAPHPVPKVIVTAAHPSLLEHIRARFAGVAGFFDKPPHPGKLHDMLLKT